MGRARITGCIALTLLVAAVSLYSQEHVFRSGVAVVRVDVQVLGPSSTSVTDLDRSDFVLREHDRPIPIRYFGRDEQALDILLLLDVSVSMGPHVSRMVETAHSSLASLRPGDRVGIMVFDRKTRLRLELNGNIDHVRDELDETLHEENFMGGTDIHYALYEAAKYMRKRARPEARRAVVILTDDRTEMTRKDNLVLRGLWQSDSILCSLVVEAKFTASRTEPANVEGLARQTGGDTIRSANAAEALQATLDRIRQRYTLGFHVPEGLTPGASRNITVELTPEARTRVPNANVQARRGYVVPDPAEKLQAGSPVPHTP
jgi:VWFA-related protein